MPLPTNIEPIATLMLGIILVAITCCCGMCVLLIGWRGKTAGVTLGWMVVGCGVAILVLVLGSLPRYWWISLPTLFLGIQSLRVWRRQGGHGIRLNTLLLIVAFVAGMCGGIGHLHRQRQAEEPIVDRLEALVGNGDVERDFDGLATGLILYEAQSESLEEILSLLTRLPHIRRLQMSHCSISLEEAKLMGRLSNLRQLWLQSTDVDDTKLAYVSRLKKLQDLDLMDTKVTDAGLQYLDRARRLRRIWLSKTRISPLAVEQLRARLPRLQVSY